MKHIYNKKAIAPKPDIICSQLLDFDQAFFNEFDAVIGVDEAGRGPLAGPVTASAVLLTKRFFQENKTALLGCPINDSKKLTKSKREEVYRALHQLRTSQHFDFTVAEASVEEIEEHNILGATTIAMRRAIHALLEECPAFSVPLTDSSLAALLPMKHEVGRVQILVDGRPVKKLTYPHQAIVKGDGKSFVIGAASVLAKVSRDHVMETLSSLYPDYGFDRHAGYGTKLHYQAINQHGVSPCHRKSFLRKYFENKNAVSSSQESELFM